MHANLYVYINFIKYTTYMESVKSQKLLIVKTFCTTKLLIMCE